MEYVTLLYERRKERMERKGCYPSSLFLRVNEGISERNNPSIFVFPAGLRHRCNPLPQRLA